MIRSNRRNIFLTPLSFVINIAIVFVMYFVCRVEYVVENWSAIGTSLFDNSLSDIVMGSLRFDTSAILYTNLLYAILMLIPLHYKETRTWQQLAKWVFVIVNGIAIVMNLADSVYFRYTGKRTTMSVLQEFENEGNLSNIIGEEVINHWYLFLLGITMIFLLWRFYVTLKGECVLNNAKDYRAYYIINFFIFAFFIPLTIAGMRGGFTRAVRPITLSNANQYVTHPKEAAAILNTPFSMFRTLGKRSFKELDYAASEIDDNYSALHAGNEKLVPNKKNVVVLIVESFGREYVEEGFAPFVKSLEAKSLTFDRSFANGRKSIDAMPSILSSIPMFLEPFFLTPASMNDVSGIAGELRKIGYQTSFFHGAENGSMGFEAFAKTTGFGKYYGRTEYNEDKRFNGDDDFDGTWAIWDEPFLQYYVLQMSEMKEPFMTAVFTASSHHPFNVPAKYENVYKEDGKNSIHRCIRYTDMAIRKFFETASKQTWYKNTIFVLTCDHTNGFDKEFYGTDMGLYAVPLIIFDPTGETVKPERRHGIAQQIDIMPTVLSLVAYNKPYIAFGQDLTVANDENTWAVNYNNGIYQFVKGDFFLQFDGQKVTGLYNYKKDPLQKENLVGKKDINLPNLKTLKAILQDYMRRMKRNELIIKE